MKHLNAVDGLRAVAVLAVIAYHAGLPVQSGFVGVDVFFVISGYLITKLLHDEVQATGRIDFLAFYARRARRILPALFVVGLATLVVAGQTLPPDALHQTLRSAAAALLFAGNVFFAAMPTGYFDPQPTAMPLLHLWSLGVEEQFYLVWPVVLILARRRPVEALASLAVVSLALSFWMPAQAAFYQMPARAWELALGGLVALRPFAAPKGSAWAGLALVMLACAAPMGVYPGVLGAALLIAAIQNGERCAVLESRPMVFVGLISYSLYLWHWPVLLLGRLWLIPTAELVALAFVLAVASYYWVESPVRRQPNQPRADVGAAAVVLVIGLVGLVMLPNVPSESPSIYAMGCDDWYASAKVKPCIFGPVDAPHTAVVMGDSVGLQWFPALFKVFEKPGWRLVVLTKSGCPMVDEKIKHPRKHREYSECSRWRADALRKVTTIHPDLVILGSSASYDLTAAQWAEGTNRVLQTVSPSAGAVRILRPTPLRSGPTAQGAAVYRALTQEAGQFRNVRVVDMNDLVCPSGHCPAHIFRDDQHLMVPFAASLSKALGARLSSVTGVNPRGDSAQP